MKKSILTILAIPFLLTPLFSFADSPYSCTYAIHGSDGNVWSGIKILSPIEKKSGDNTITIADQQDSAGWFTSPSITVRWANGISSVNTANAVFAVKIGYDENNYCDMSFVFPSWWPFSAPEVKSCTGKIKWARSSSRDGDADIYFEKLD